MVKLTGRQIIESDTKSHMFLLIRGRKDAPHIIIHMFTFISHLALYGVSLSLNLDVDVNDA